jgi:hypothetical protein
MPTFDFLPLLWWGLPLAAAPVAIHLINLLRHRRVKFAAMEFLLASQRRYRTRVLLREILLLLLRMAVVAGIVIALAQPRWRHALGTLFGGGRTLHVLLVDDSYSMTDRSADGRVGAATAFDRARGVADRVLAELAATGGPQEFMAGTFSALASGSAAGFGMPRQPATPENLRAARAGIERWTASARTAGPRQPLATTAALLAGDSGGGKVVWLVSDFRIRDWEAAEETASSLRALAAAGAELRLVDCAAAPAANLVVERLAPAGGTAAAGVLVPWDVTVRNVGAEVVRDVPIELREDGTARPGIRVTEIPPRAAVTRRFETRFTRAGSHLVDARLPADAVATDNLRTAAVDVAERVDVLVIDGATPAAGRAGDAFYVAAALAPGAGAPTGLRPRIEPPQALGTLDLTAFAAVWLLDVERLAAAEITALEAYARGGGGVVFFLGPRSDADTINATLHRGGAGLFPVPLAGPVDLLPDTNAAPVPDIVVEQHPVVAVLAGQRNPLLDAVQIGRFMAVARGHEADAGVRRLLSLRTGPPLVVERPYGTGLVAAVLTTAAPVWNNWSRGNPSWVVVLLELQGHLARGRQRVEPAVVGDPLIVRLEQGSDEPEVEFVVPPAGVVSRQAASPTATGLEARLPTTDTPGGYAARWRRLDGTEREQVFAVNVDPAEGRLERCGRERLDVALAGIAFRYDAAEALEPAALSTAGEPLARPLLYGLIAALLAEQALAFAASYHPRRSATPAGRAV